MNTRNKKELVKAHAYITYNVKIKSSQRKILLCNNAEFIEKSTKSGKIIKHSNIYYILTENACNINNPKFIFIQKKRTLISKIQSITNSFQNSSLHMYF